MGNGDTGKQNLKKGVVAPKFEISNFGESISFENSKLIKPPKAELTNNSLGYIGYGLAGCATIFLLNHFCYLREANAKEFFKQLTPY